jgi:arylsulfatase A-like enzyme
MNRNSQLNSRTLIRVIFLILCCSLGCQLFATKEESKHNIIIISVDTLRADHLGCYGYPLNTSPEIDAFSKDGILFSQSYSITPLTSPAFASMLTSLPPHKHGSKRNGLSIYKDICTLPLFLKPFGYTSAAFVSNWSLRKKLCGLDKDFDVYSEVLEKRRWMGVLNSEGDARIVTRKACTWLENNTHKRIFLWIHYTEPHAPYMSHSQFRITGQKQHKSIYPAGTHFHKIKNYDSEIGLVDFHVGKLIATLRALGLYEEAVIIFNSDHGESFGEHRYFRHGRKLYNSTLKVPLIFKLPGNRMKHQIRNDFASILDIAPTILSILKIPLPSQMEGVNLMVPGSRKTLFFETYKGTAIFSRGMKFKTRVYPIKYGMIRNSQKIILTDKSRRFEVYDLKTDNFELNNIYIYRDNKFLHLESLLKRYAEETRNCIKQTRKYHLKPGKLSPDDIEKLKSLGYIQE